MAQCKYCGISSWFFNVTESGLCANCSHIVSLDVEQRSRLIEESSRAADQTQNPHSRLARWELMLKQLEALAKYEERGIKTIDGSPGEMLKDVQTKRDALVSATAQAEAQDILKQVQETPVPEKKIAFYNKILLRMAEYRKMMSDASGLDGLERQVKDSVHQIRLSVPLEKALSVETRGKKEKALEHYLEALQFLRSNDPERARLSEHIPRIEEKIRALGGTIPK